MEDEEELLDCPNCGRTYDDADADFCICHHCGYNAETKTIDLRKRSMKGFGIDPDITIEM